MEDPIDGSVYVYESTALVEITWRDATDELLVVSYEFDVDGTDETVARPRGSIDPDHEPVVRELLAGDGLRLSDD